MRSRRFFRTRRRLVQYLGGVGADPPFHLFRRFFPDPSCSTKRRHSSTLNFPSLHLMQSRCRSPRPPQLSKPLLSLHASPSHACSFSCRAVCTIASVCPSASGSKLLLSSIDTRYAHEVAQTPFFRPFCTNPFPPRFFSFLLAPSAVSNAFLSVSHNPDPPFGPQTPLSPPGPLCFFSF